MKGSACGLLLWTFPLALLCGQNIKTGPEVGQPVPGFLAKDQEGRPQTLLLLPNSITPARRRSRACTFATLPSWLPLGAICHLVRVSLGGASQAGAETLTGYEKGTLIMNAITR
jgi:hypothetical protein